MRSPNLHLRPYSDYAESLFGPAISKVPRGNEALKLWDAVQILAETAVAVIKRSMRSAPEFT